jgi:hypothetical protein
VVLGLVDRGVNESRELVRSVDALPSMGHLVAPPELVNSAATLTDLIDLLQHSNLVVEGELGLEVTPAGTQVRSTVKFRPREGVVSRVLAKLGITVNFNV